jgi:hypothetical protein
MKYTLPSALYIAKISGGFVDSMLNLTMGFSLCCGNVDTKIIGLYSAKAVASIRKKLSSILVLPFLKSSRYSLYKL